MIAEANFRHNDINSFLDELGEAQDKEKFFKEYVKSVRLNDQKVNSVISLYSNQEILEEYYAGAEKEFHGVPILLKDNIDSIGIANTAGSLAFKNNLPKNDAPLVSKLRKSGFIILGKANLSEWANFRGNPSTSGWTSINGQTNNPFNLKYNPCGSSSGSAAAIAQGLVPVSIGTETNGSITCPASVNGVVGIKPTVGLVSRTGVIPISETQDTAGPMAKNVMDAAKVLKAIAGKDPLDSYTAKIPQDYDYEKLTDLDANYLKGKRVGVLNSSESSEIEKELIKKVKKILKAKGAVIVDVEFNISSDYKAAKEFYVLLYEFNVGMKNYLKGRDLPYKTLEDIDEINKANADTVLKHFGQEIFLESLKATDTERYLKEREDIGRLAKAQIDSVLKVNNLDVIIGLTRNPGWLTDLENGDSRGDGGISWANGGLSAVAGYPHITIPLDFANDLPVGVSFLGTAWDEANLINAAYSFEQENKFFPIPK